MFALLVRVVCAAFNWKWQISSAGSVILSHPDVPIRYVAFNDIATVAATALTTNQYDKQTVSIQGPAAITGRQQVAAISQLLSKPIAVVEVSEAEYKEKTPAAPAPVVDSIHIYQRFRRERGADYQANTDALVTGSTTFEQFVAANKHEYSV